MAIHLKRLQVADPANIIISGALPLWELLAGSCSIVSWVQQCINLCIELLLLKHNCLFALIW